MGELGLHRPFLGGSAPPRQGAENDLAVLYSTIRNYVLEMGITDKFYQTMMNTDPSDVAVYRRQELAELVPVIDPIADEVKKTQHARQFGISVPEYRKREAYALSHCYQSGRSDGGECAEAVYWGLSVPVFQERFAKMKAECIVGKFTEDEKALYKKTPVYERDDLSFIEKSHSCARKVMLGR